MAFLSLRLGPFRPLPEDGTYLSLRFGERQVRAVVTWYRVYRYSQPPINFPNAQPS